MSKYILSTVIVILLLWGCSEEKSINPSNGNSNQFDSGWLINHKYVFDGGVGKDGIPSIQNPKKVNASKADYLNDDDLVIIGNVEGAVRAYPHKILDWHEIINDSLNGRYISMNYCPLTGTGLLWNRVIEGKITTFGVSGLLYNSNLIPYDRETNSNWSQMEILCVNGTRKGLEPDLFRIIETTWETAKQWYPEIEVISDNTGFARSYEYYPYLNAAGQDYREFNDVLFPVEREDCTRHNKERLYGIIEGESVTLYSFSNFERGFDMLQQSINGVPYLIIGDAEKNFMTAFKRMDLGQNPIDFEIVADEEPVVMRDENGNGYSVFGEILEGPNKGNSLEQAKGYMGYWFSWVAVFPELNVVDFRPPDLNLDCK